ncbi:hypothetical protein ACYOEI_11070 [Singulisphaera rosea]
MSDAPNARTRRYRPRLSLRRLMILVLIVCEILGWPVHRPKVQINAAEAIRARFPNLTEVVLQEVPASQAAIAALKQASTGLRVNH